MLSKILVIGGALSTGVISSLFRDREFITLLNTTLNAASWYLLIKAQRRLRNDIAPALENVEEQVTAVANQVSAPPHAIEGGRRAYDPPCESDDK